jgi:hypothetical protein
MRKLRLREVKKLAPGYRARNERERERKRERERERENYVPR